MSERKIIKAAGHHLEGSTVKVDSQLEFDNTSNPEAQNFDSFIWKLVSGDATSWKLRDETKLQDIMTVDTLNDIITFGSNYDIIVPSGSTVPLTSGDTGTQGTISFSGNGVTDYLYVCVATNTWKRVELSGW